MRTAKTNKEGIVTDKTNLKAPDITNAYSRRRMIAGSAIGLASVAIAGARAGTEQASGETGTTNAITMAKAIHQEEDFKARPQQIYQVLLDAKQFSAFSGSRPAEIRGEVGGAFSLFTGHIVGLNVELVANRRIVQAWRVVNWPEGVYSIARFELQGQGSGTRVLFDHTGFPPDLAEHLASGWQENYWKPLRKYVG
jgi:activator of HSP90 ATPase